MIDRQMISNSIKAKTRNNTYRALEAMDEPDSIHAHNENVAGDDRIGLAFALTQILILQKIAHERELFVLQILSDLSSEMKKQREHEARAIF